jgi:hypothetical protein
MVMALFRGMRHPDPQYSAISVREAKYTRLAYMTRLSRLHTLNPPFSISFSEKQPFGNTETEPKNNQMTPDKSQVPQADSPVTGLHNLN